MAAVIATFTKADLLVDWWYAACDQCFSGPEMESIPFVFTYLGQIDSLSRISARWILINPLFGFVTVNEHIRAFVSKLWGFSLCGGELDTLISYRYQRIYICGVQESHPEKHHPNRE
jgi:hypothetical protein